MTSSSRIYSNCLYFCSARLRRFTVNYVSKEVSTKSQTGSFWVRPVFHPSKWLLFSPDAYH